jgi:hypothetical protein
VEDPQGVWLFTNPFKGDTALALLDEVDASNAHQTRYMRQSKKTIIVIGGLKLLLLRICISANGRIDPNGSSILVACGQDDIADGPNIGKLSTSGSLQAVDEAGYANTFQERLPPLPGLIYGRWLSLRCVLKFPPTGLPNTVSEFIHGLKYAFTILGRLCRMWRFHMDSEHGVVKVHRISTCNVQTANLCVMVLFQKLYSRKRGLSAVYTYQGHMVP